MALSGDPDYEALRLAMVRHYALVEDRGETAGILTHLVRAAAFAYRTPIASATLVGEREIRCLSRFGIDFEKIPREPGLCASTVMDGKTRILPDAANDPLASANSLVSGGVGIRFYLGEPLKTHDGFSIGTLCVADREARTNSSVNPDALRELAGAVMQAIEDGLERRAAGNLRLRRLRGEILNELSYSAFRYLQNQTIAYFTLAKSLENSLQPGMETHAIVTDLSRKLAETAKVAERHEIFVEQSKEGNDFPNINDTVESLLEILRPRIKEIEIRIKLDMALKTLKADTSQLPLALALIITQTADAMPRSGTLFIETSFVVLEERFFGKFAELPPGEYATISIISEMSDNLNYEQLRTALEHAQKLDNWREEPSLASAQEFIAAGGGQIDFMLGPERRLTSTIYLPVITPVPEPPVNDEGRFRILFVDSDDSIRSAYHLAFGKRGFLVSFAESGQAALRMFPEGSGFDVLVTDVVMPKMNGLKLAEEFRRHRPELLIVFTSVYSRKELNLGELPPRSTFLRKPVMPDQLIDHINSLLPENIE